MKTITDITAVGKVEPNSIIQCDCLEEIKYQLLNLGECSDGSKFTSVNQAINQAKGIVNSVSNCRKTN